MDLTPALAHSITRDGSKQTYFIGRFMVDKDLKDDFFRAYAYFRWVDNIVDITSRSDDERILFINRQKDLIDYLYNNKTVDSLLLEEKMVVDLINHGSNKSQEKNSSLQSYIRNFLAVIEFDAGRNGRSISQKELTWYSDCLGKAVTDGVQYFIGNGYLYPDNDRHYQAAIAAHITHLLRDMLVDLEDGFINIPDEYLLARGISPQDTESPQFRDWVETRVKKAREYFHEGKQYLEELDVLRCKVVGFWYCARYEYILDIIEQDNYLLRREYKEQHQFITLTKQAWLGGKVILRHMTKRRKRSELVS